MNRREAAIAVLQDVPSSSDGHPQIAITVVLAVIGTIVAIYSCLKEHPLFDAGPVRHPNLLQRIRVRRAVRRVLADHGSTLDPEEVADAIFLLGSRLTRDQIYQLANEG